MAIYQSQILGITWYNSLTTNVGRVYATICNDGSNFHAGKKAVPNLIPLRSLQIFQFCFAWYIGLNRLIVENLRPLLDQGTWNLHSEPKLRIPFGNCCVKNVCGSFLRNYKLSNQSLKLQDIVFENSRNLMKIIVKPWWGLS